MWYRLARPLLFSLPPETAHHLTLRSLAWVERRGLIGAPVASAPCTVMGLTFPNRVGLAAGLDKNAECIDGLAALGFGFVEVGTITPRPQAGNPTPRLFRLPAARALINRMGFNNLGVDVLLENIRRSSFSGIIGINIGKNADTPLEHAADDYLIGLRKVYAHASYVTVNLSSPNTPGLRSLQHGQELEKLLHLLKTTQTALAAEYGKYVPLLIKIAPDLEPAELQDIAVRLLAYEIDGVIATNTTSARTGVAHLRHGQESGGLSGAPLYERATDIVRELHRITQGKIPIIAAGGIFSAAHAAAKIEAGASLVQLYTGLIYQGPGLVKACVKALV
jgi:dihydroorotate dehydrogenase